MTALIRGIVLCAVLSVAGCIMRPGPGGDPENPSSGGASAIVVRNNSGATICYVNISSSSDSDWGGDQLGSSETVVTGASRTWPVGAGNYDIRLQDCNHGTIAERRGIAVSGSTDVSVP